MRIFPTQSRAAALTRTEVIIMLVVLGVGLLLLLAMTIPCMVPARGQAQMNSIANNLRIIEGAKEQWALQNQKVSSDAVMLSDLTAFFKNNQVPPAVVNETYEVSTVGALARAVVTNKVNGKPGPFTTTSF